jgi:cyclophilin family peptidyl-prolyl cis-trans isomerase
MNERSSLDRRDFLKGLVIAGAPGAFAQSGGMHVSLVLDPADPVAASAAAKWAVNELRHALTEHGVSVSQYEALEKTPAKDVCVVAAGGGSRFATAGLRAAGVSMPNAPESLALLPARDATRSVVLACGSDPRGLVYALLELADRVRHSADPMTAIPVKQALAEQPANSVRSVARMFVSDVHDKPWFQNQEMWPDYLTMLATQRFNRFALTLGIGYDFLREVTDAYFLFAYPFFLAVPGYNVRAVNLPETERDRNLEMLQYISEQTVARGLEFQLGIWTHGYQWANSPNPNYTIEGLSAANHAEYCRDALAALLKACPAIGGITFRVHGESGVPEGSYGFWKTVFEGVTKSGRKVEIDMHNKGMDQGMIDVALGTGMPVRISPKFWAEHLGMPYHQADIRDQEIPREGHNPGGLMALSTGSRSFTRYGYADLLREDRRYGVLHRIWPGTQRLLVWGDPAMAAGYSRAFSFCGSSGVEIFEPLSFKGRRGSGLPGDRCGYADPSLVPQHDFEKYEYSFRVWGRLLYNPAAAPETWRRGLANPAAETALASASRILPIVTTAHGPSAANNTYWPEMYTNQPMVDPRNKNPYTDTPSPKTFQNASPFDPQLFSRMSDHADELLKGERSGKYSPVEVAQWLDSLADVAAKNLAAFDAKGPEQRRIAIDIGLQAGLGRFFAAKLRAGVLYSIHEKTGDRAALEEALKQYRSARDIWAALAERARGVYLPDITVGEHPWLRGHWLDRLPAIDRDIADMAKRLDAAKSADDPRVRTAVAAVLNGSARTPIACRHTAPATFTPSQALSLQMAAALGKSARLYYRHVNQAERWLSVDMQGAEGNYTAVIPADYTASQYPLQYYFEVKDSPDKAWLYPGFAADFSNQPYFVVRAAKSAAVKAVGAPHPALLDPKHPLWSRPAPEAYRVAIETTKGGFVMEVTRSLAPRGADRFYHLVETGFYDNSRFFRVIQGRFAQFGIPGDPAIGGIWRNASFPDDSVRASNVRGTFAYAMTGPDARTTQIYINTSDQLKQDAGGFAPFGKVVAGMDAVDRLYSEYGERSGSGMRAGRQGKLFEEGNAYLDREFPLLDKLLIARICKA